MLFVLVLVKLSDPAAPTTWHQTEPLDRRFGQSGDNVDPLTPHVAFRAANADLSPSHLGRSDRP
jgi:hypothetical protein